MDQEQIREYAELHDVVTRKLRHHAYIDDRNVLHAFQYFVLPAFTPLIAWDVFRRSRKDQPHEHVLIRSCWRSDMDQEKLCTPAERLRHPYPLVPTIEVHELSSPSADLERLAEDLGTLKLPIGASPAVAGVDGVTFEVAIGQPPDDLAFSARCRLSWWCEPPAAWGELRTWLTRAEKLFETAWTGRGNSAAVPLQVRTFDDVAARHEAQRLFHEGHYGRTAELLADIASRGKLSPAEEKMFELALQRAGSL